MLIYKLAVEITHEFIEKIVIYATDNRNGHRTHQIEIHFLFDVSVATAILNRRILPQKRKAA